MLKFFATSGFFFIITVTAILGMWLLLFIGISSEELLKEVERKYGFKASIIVFLVVLAIISCVASAVRYLVL